MSTLLHPLQITVGGNNIWLSVQQFEIATLESPIISVRRPNIVFINIIAINHKMFDQLSAFYSALLPPLFLCFLINELNCSSGRFSNCIIWCMLRDNVPTNTESWLMDLRFLGSAGCMSNTKLHLVINLANLVCLTNLTCTSQNY